MSRAFGADVAIDGELRQWHKVTLTVDGPKAAEDDGDINPFLDYRVTVNFEHESGAPRYAIPGYFAADGAAGTSSATEGRKWRAHLTPDKTGRWKYEVIFVKGDDVAILPEVKGEPVSGADGLRGDFEVGPTDKKGRDFRARGRLEYVGERYLRFSGNGNYFIKVGSDSPENLLAYRDFDGTYLNPRGEHKRRGLEAAPPPDLKSWEPHVRDWRSGDPTWKEDRGKGLIGAFNYLAGKGCNAVTFLLYNAGGDSDDVWPFVERNDKFHYDCSKLDQWQIVFDHAQRRGIHLQFKLQETENDDNRRHGKRVIPESLDGGKLGRERKLYLREIMARYGYLLAVTWSLGEGNSQSREEQRAMTSYIREVNPYPSHVVLHTFPTYYEKVCPALLGDGSELTGLSLQNPWAAAHQRSLQWINTSKESGKPWVVTLDEINPHYTGVPPDAGYAGFDGIARPPEITGEYTVHDIRKYALWGQLMAGGAGVTYYFGHTLPQNDLNAEDLRSRDSSWTYAGIARRFFLEIGIPFWKLQNADELVGNAKHGNSVYCLADPGSLYVIYLPEGGEAELDLGESKSTFRVQWFDPRSGGVLQAGAVATVAGSGIINIGTPPVDQGKDWVAVVSRSED